MDKEKKKLLVFGYGLAIILGFLGIRSYIHKGINIIAVILCVFSFVLAILSLIYYKLLIPIYKRWMKVAHIIGTIISGIILTVIFYLLFGTIGIMFRLFRNDLLDRKIDSSLMSYWHKRERAVFDKKNYLKQF